MEKETFELIMQVNTIILASSVAIACLCGLAYGIYKIYKHYNP